MKGQAIIINYKYTITAMIMAVSMASCSEVPKGISINSKENESCLTTTTSSSLTTTTHTTTTTTTTMDATTTMTTETEVTMTMNTTTNTEVVFQLEEECTTEPIVTTTTYYTEPIYGNWDGVWYCGRDMGYTSNPYGASGNLLISNYSVASDYFPFGTLLFIESDYMCGTFRVDDCGVGTSNVIDFYFYDRSEIPTGFLNAGRIPLTITLIE